MKKVCKVAPSSAYDPCTDEALRAVLSLEVENDSEEFKDYELSEEAANKINERSFAIITGLK